MDKQDEQDNLSILEDAIEAVIKGHPAQSGVQYDENDNVKSVTVSLQKLAKYRLDCIHEGYVNGVVDATLGIVKAVQGADGAYRVEAGENYDKDAVNRIDS